jgi:hypothetical protein
MSIFDQAQTSTFDPGPSVEDIDRDLADVAIVTLERYARELDPEQIKAKRWEYLPVEQRRALRAGNELAKRNYARERADRKRPKISELRHSILLQIKPGLMPIGRKYAARGLVIRRPLMRPGLSYCSNGKSTRPALLLVRMISASALC